MGVREGGSYVVDPKSGAITLVEQTQQEDASRVVEEGPAPEVETAPAVPAAETPVEDAAAGRRRGAETKPQE